MSNSPEQIAGIVGVWEYDASGSPYLEEGLLQITVSDGHLRGMISDELRGRMAAHVRVRGNRPEVRMDGLHVSGYVEDGVFQAFCRRPIWDVSTSQDVRQTGHRQRTPSSGTLVARRVQSFASERPASPAHCDPVLEEVDYHCTSRLLP
jgi:hypothetical protein